MAIPKHLILVGDTYYANVRVPSDMVATYGKANVRVSLRTKDEKQAGRLVHDKVVEIQRGLDAHRAKIKEASAPVIAKAAPTPQTFADLGRQHGRDIAERQLTIRADLYEAAVADPKGFWRSASTHYSAPDEFSYFDKLVADGDLDRVVGYVVRKTTEGRLADLKRMIDTGDMGELLTHAEELLPGLDRKSHVALALTLARSEMAALQNALSGDLEGHRKPPEASQPSASISGSTTPSLPPVSLDTLFEKWQAGGIRKSPSTLSTWRGHLNAFKAAFPDKADNAGSFTPDDIIKWKDNLVAKGLTPKTINDGYLACMRTLFGYGVDNRLISGNPALRIKATGKAGKTRFGYTNAEVARLLEAARLETNPVRRWLPWLAAQTGSRIGEVAQLWGSFVKQEDGIWYLDIKPAPDAGTIKEDVSKRQVPIHPTIIEDGFLEFVKSKGDGPLFYKKSSGDPDKKHASKGVSNHIGTWIRSIGFDDPRKAPNHAIRHWFKTYASSSVVGLQDRMVDKLQGHAPRSESDKYYEPDLWEKLEALRKLALPPVAREIRSHEHPSEPEDEPDHHDHQ